MSKNSQNSTRTFSARRHAAAEDFSIASAMAEADAARSDEQSSSDLAYLYSRHVSGEGLAALENAGAGAFEAVTGHHMPHNLVSSDFRSNLVVAGYRLNEHAGRRMPIREADELIIAAARFGGWLKAAANLSAVRKLLRKTQSSRGINSPYTTISLRALVARWPSPGQLERRLWAVRKRAEAILCAYEGQKPSWANIGQALMHERRVGKAAIQVVARQLGWNGNNYRYLHDGNYVHMSYYKAAREWLVAHRKAAFPVADNSDGVMCWVATPKLQKLGITVSLALTIAGFPKWDMWKRGLIFFVRKGERTFHSQSGSPEWAMREAVQAWKRQDELAARNADLVAFLKGDGHDSCPLFRREDSYAAGNCSPGTESFVRSVGWSDRKFIPGIALIPHLDDERVRRVVVARMPREQMTA